MVNTKREHVAWIAVGIFGLIVVAYFWFKNQIATANQSGFNQGVNALQTAVGGINVPGLGSF